MATALLKDMRDGDIFKVRLAFPPRSLIAPHADEMQGMRRMDAVEVHALRRLLGDDQELYVSPCRVHLFLTSRVG